MDLGIWGFLFLEQKGKVNGDLVVLGVGGEIKIWEPKKFEDSNGFGIEAMAGPLFQISDNLSSLFLSLYIILYLSGFCDFGGNRDWKVEYLIIISINGKRFGMKWDCSV